MPMPNTRTADFRYNSSSCRDNTAHEAISNIQKEERRKLITALKDLANQHGYRIVSLIELEEMEQKIWTVIIIQQKDVKF